LRGVPVKGDGEAGICLGFPHFSSVIAQGVIQNSSTRLDASTVEFLTSHDPGNRARFIEETFSGIFYTPGELRTLDRISANIAHLENAGARALAMAALIRSCLKKQPRGVFTISGDLSHYDDGRRDLRLSFEEHFTEQAAAFNRVVFDNGHRNLAVRSSAFEARSDVDLVYLDPPYVPRSDDNCYIKRYHFLEGLSCYWQGLRIMPETKARKIEKPYTPFSYRKTAVEAFDQLFARYHNSIIVLSYSSNGYPDLEVLKDLLRRHKTEVHVFSKPHRYHFGTHSKVRRAEVDEYLIVGR